MSSETKAVFLSYASQDAEAARRICDALRSAGIEVWFDQSELRGGDAWDQKIRKQIKDCALFVPVISANTNARLEGYFRREWRLAVDRMHDMDDEVPFLLPVVIDDTSDAAARVPERFRERQWIRIGSADSLSAFAERARKLLAAGATAERRPEEQGARTARSGEARSRGPGRLWLVPAILGAVAVGLGLPIWNTIHRPERPGAQVPGVMSEARKLAEQARGLMEEDDANPENFRLAEQLLIRATAADPGDGDILALYAELSHGFVRFGFDQSPARLEMAKTQAERAFKLAPTSFETRFARAYYYYRADPPEAERLLRQMLAEQPADKRLLRTLGLSLRRQDRQEEAIAVWRRAAGLPGGDALAMREIALSLFSIGRAAEAETAVDQSLQLYPMVRARLLKAEIEVMARGDLAGAENTLRQLPPWALLEVRGAYLVSQVRLWRRDADGAIAALERLPGDYLADNLFTGPKSYLIGQAHKVAKRDAAAEREWRLALAVVDRTLAADPRSIELLYWRAHLLTALGAGVEARQAATIFEQGTQDHAGKILRLARIDLLRGEAESALNRLEAELKSARRWTVTERFTEHALRLDPFWDPLHGNPRYEKLAATPTSVAAKAEHQTPKSEVSTSAPPDSKSVAVLAFANLSDDKDNEYFSDGISEELLNVLAKVPGLKVSARTSAFSFKGKGVAIPEIARQLGVAYVVEGSVRKAGNRVRITAQLIKASDGFHVWSDNFDRELKDIFAVQDEIAGLVARNLQVRIGASAGGGSAAIDPQVYEWYLQGREGWRQRNEAGYARAEAMFDRVLQRQPDFARAHVGLSDVWLNRAQETVAVGAFNQRNAPALQRIRAAAGQALQLDAGLAEAHASFASVRWMEWKLDEAIRELRLALRLNPNDASAHQWLGRCLLASGEMAEALQELKEAHELDPLMARIADNYSLALLAAQRPQEALDLAERALALQPDSIQARRFQIVALAELGRASECREAAQRYQSVGGDTTPHFVSYALARIGARTEAEEILRSVGKVQREPSRGATLLALGRAEEWLADLNPAEFNILTIDGLFFWPVFDPVRSDPRFVKLLATLGATEAHARAQAWRASSAKATEAKAANQETGNRSQATGKNGKTK